MLGEICAYLKNWFDRDQPKFFGKFIIENGVLESVNDGNDFIQADQYFRIIGSAFNDGIYTWPAQGLKDESFDGAIWAMAVPPVVIALAAEAEEWVAKYGGVDSVNMSPFNSESFGGYSYSKSGGGAAAGSELGAPGTWQSVFAARLSPWRKAR